jgi:alpha-galactosidase
MAPPRAAGDTIPCGARRHPARRATQPGAQRRPARRANHPGGAQRQRSPPARRYCGTVRPDSLVRLRSTGTEIVLSLSDDRLPQIVHWGADLGDAEVDLTPIGPGEPHVEALGDLGILKEQSHEWSGTPGLSGHRSGRDFSTLFVPVSAATDATSVRVESKDIDAGLALVVEVEMLPGGLVRTRLALTNEADGEYTVDSLAPALPVPLRATELLDFAGRWTKERIPQRSAFTVGTHLRQNRRGRTGFDASLVLAAGTPGFDFAHGDVWGVHTAWSGNHSTLAERSTTGLGMLSGGELLLPGEVRLGTGETYTTPWLYGAWGHGLDEVAARFHEYLRSREGHPHSPRPVVMNTWEAVYFDQSLERLSALADAGARVGVERFVIDDGWFRGRNDDTAGLGDWFVDESTWPNGLAPIVEHVKGLGMQFGLWFEPEMVNPHSDLARQHPDWILGLEHRDPPLRRAQHVLDLARPEVSDYLFERIDALVTELGIDYIKWDHNRDLVEPGHRPTGTAGVHQQTLAVYALLDRVRAAHPGLEIESCSSGGARIDLAILERTDRVWDSDCIDPLERQRIQRWTSQLLPLELQGSHVGSSPAHTTGRRHSLGFRAGTALFGHFGIEWDLTAATEEELDDLAEWVTLYKRLRPLLHTGRLVRIDHADPTVTATAVIALDASRAAVSVAILDTSTYSAPSPILVPGLDPDARYRLSIARTSDPAHTEAPAWDVEGSTSTGRQLAVLGFTPPRLRPEQLIILELTRV